MCQNKLLDSACSFRQRSPLAVVEEQRLSTIRKTKDHRLCRSSVVFDISDSSTTVNHFLLVGKK